MGRKRKNLRLDVLINGTLTGTLTRNSSGAMEFVYSPSWINSEGATPLSLSLPLREEAYRDARVPAYFDNLLPDNDTIRQRIAERFSSESKNAFDLLAAIGRDCVGALQFVPEGEKLEATGEIQGEPLTAKQIAEILKSLKTFPLGLGKDRDFRISLAGAQEKTALLRWKGKWYRPHGSTATTHIFKPQIGELPNGIDFSHSVENEWLCLRLIEHFGLRTAKAEIADFDGIRCLVVERFDRAWSKNGNKLTRIPQEDLCQALGVPSTRKYESDGGPGMREIMDLLNASDLRAEDRRDFVLAQILFFLLAATDGHAKNFSIFLRPGGFRLTPLYDVLSVAPALEERQLEIKEAKLAMSVGESRHYRLREILRRHWEQTAKLCGFPASELEALITDIRKRADALDGIRKDVKDRVPRQVLEPILEGIQRRLKALGG